MKTKLLKKVRKRYVIYKVTSIAANEKNETILESYECWGLPFYKVVDTKNPFGYRFITARYYNHALHGVLEFVREDYTDKVKHSKTKLTKVWPQEK